MIEDSGGFAVEQSGMNQLVGSTHDNAEYMRGCLNALRGLPSATTEIFGDGGVVDAYQQFVAVWADEMSIIAGGMDQINTTLLSTNRAYGTVDSQAGHLFQPTRH